MTCSAGCCSHLSEEQCFHSVIQLVVVEAVIAADDLDLLFPC